MYTRVLRLTELGRLRWTVRVRVGRLSMAQKRTSCCEEKSPICTACRRMSGSDSKVRYHSDSTASMAFSV